MVLPWGFNGVLTVSLGFSIGLASLSSIFRFSYENKQVNFHENQFWYNYRKIMLFINTSIQQKQQIYNEEYVFKFAACNITEHHYLIAYNP